MRILNEHRPHPDGEFDPEYMGVLEDFALFRRVVRNSSQMRQTIAEKYEPR